MNYICVKQDDEEEKEEFLFLKKELYMCKIK